MRACRAHVLISSFVGSELGGLQDPQWPVLRQAMHQAVFNLTKTAVIANSDMGDDRCTPRCTEQIKLGQLMHRNKSLRYVLLAPRATCAAGEFAMGYRVVPCTPGGK